MCVDKPHERSFIFVCSTTISDIFDTCIFTVTVVGNQVLVFGGYASAGQKGDMFVLDTSSWCCCGLPDFAYAPPLRIPLLRS